MVDLQGLPVYLQGCGATNLPAGVRDFDTLMMRALPARPDPRLRAGMTPNTVMAYIYTSGTTGILAVPQVCGRDHRYVGGSTGMWEGPQVCVAVPRVCVCVCGGGGRQGRGTTDIW